MRTDAEILARIIIVGKNDWLGTQTGVYTSTLSFEVAKPLLKESCTAEDWGDPIPRDDETIKAEMLGYMEFAWGKANDCRGISAGRSIDHYSAWLWLLGRDAAADQILKYTQYGKPWLRAICEDFGWDWKLWDDDRWTDDETGSGCEAPETVTALIA